MQNLFFSTEHAAFQGIELQHQKKKKRSMESPVHYITQFTIMPSGSKDNLRN